MKRDMELVRLLLLAIEAKAGHSKIEPSDLVIEGYEPDDIHYHLILMDDAGLLYSEKERSSSNPDRVYLIYFIFNLTWKGHEYLDTVRDPELWRRTKSVATKAGNASVEFALEVAKALARETLQKLGLPSA